MKAKLAFNPNPFFFNTEMINKFLCHFVLRLHSLMYLYLKECLTARVCVCVCVRARVCVRACMCVCAWVCHSAVSKYIS